MSIHRTSQKIAILGLLAATTVSAQAQKVYNAAGFSDFSGPYAGVFAEWMQARESALAWWNKEVGPKLGIRIELKQYDNRYDTAQTASLWPTVKAELNPVLIFGVGAPDVSALQQRLADDKIPMMMGTAGYGYSWKPDAWVFNPRPTLSHEFGAFLDYQYEVRKQPVRFALVSSEASPGYVDFSKGLSAYAKDNSKVELVEIEHGDAAGRSDPPGPPNRECEGRLHRHTWQHGSGGGCQARPGGTEPKDPRGAVKL